MEYQDFLKTKKIATQYSGTDYIGELNKSLFDYQRDCVQFHLKCGRSAAFLDTGLGKSIVSLEYGRIVNQLENKPVLMLAPLAVGQQHAKEAAKFNIDAEVKFIREPQDRVNGINITNYDNMHKFDPSDYAGVILDESSIIKNYNGATTRKLMAAWDRHKWKLAATATPSPNDHMELGQHSQFLGAMDSNEMLARFFISDQEQMGKYRLKGYAVKDFWSWVASWARCATRPSDLGYSDDGFVLPELKTIKHIVEADISCNTGDLLFRIPETSATSIHNEKRLTAQQRAMRVAEILTPDDTWAIWCDTDYEADALLAEIPDAVEIRGSMKSELKEELLVAFSAGEIKRLITKPKLAGFGLNWQHCHKTAFIGLSFSYEQYYQAIRRFWRFGQKNAVESHIVMSDTEAQIYNVIQRKMKDHENMKTEMAEAMKREVITKTVKHAYEGNQKPKLPTFLKG